MAYIARNLKTLRESAGMSIPRLASLANVGDITIHALEDNQLPRHIDRPPYKVSRPLIDRIANALGTDLATLGAIDMDTAG